MKNKYKISECVPYQCCPVCAGTGIIPADGFINMTVTQPCKVCLGARIIPMCVVDTSVVSIRQFPMPDKVIMSDRCKMPQKYRKYKKFIEKGVGVTFSDLNSEQNEMSYELFCRQSDEFINRF